MNPFNHPGMPVDVLHDLIKSDDISKVYIALQYLKDNIHKETADKVLSQWSQIISSINLHHSPDLQLLYSEVFYALYPWNSKKAFPDWRSWRAPVVVQVNWRRLEIYLQTDPIDFDDIGEITLQALFDLDPKKLLYPEVFFEKISSSNNSNVQNIALKLMRQSVSDCTLLPHQAYQYLMMLCKESYLLVLKDGIEFLSEAWAQCEDYPKKIVDRAFNTESIEVKKSAVKLMDAWNAFDKLELILKDEKQNLLIRCEAMRSLGRTTKKDLMDDILNIASEDSLYFGEACFNALETFHHRGIFIKEKHLDDLITIFIENSK